MDALFNNRKLQLIILAAATLVAYFQVTGYHFTNWDDPKLVTDNPLIKDLSWDGIKAIFTSHLTIHYKPLVFMTWALEYKLFGLDATVMHTTNIILHILNTILLFLVVSGLTNSKPVAFFTALMFGVHPIHVESVAWITERKDVLYSAFFLGSIYTYQRFMTDESNKKLYYFSILLFVGGLLSKMMAVTLPVLLILLDWFEGRKFDWKNKVPYFAIIVLPMLLFKGFQKAFSYVLSPADTLGMPFSFLERWVLSGYEVAFYWYRLVFPAKLSAVYPFPEGLETVHLVSFVVVMGGLVLLYLKRKAIPKTVLFGLGWFGITIFPALQMFLPLGDAVTADRYMYIPMVGFFFALFSLVDHRFGWSSKLSGGLLVVGGAMILLTMNQAKAWQDSMSLWTDVLEKYPKTKIAYNYRGIGHRLSGNGADAYRDFQQAITIDPNYAEAYLNRGDANYDMKRYSDALMDYTKTLNLQPDHVKAYNNRGNAYLMMGSYDNAIADYNRALAINDKSAETYTNRGLAKANKQMHQQALIDFIYALNLDPNFAPAYYNRAYAYYHGGQFQLAYQDATRAAQLGYPVDQEFFEFLKNKVGVK